MRMPTWTIAWHEGMKVGIPEIDDDHQHFISLINDFNRAIIERRKPEYIKSKLQLITEDAARHFAHEESMLEKWQYPDIAMHAKIHALTLKSLQEIEQQFAPYGFDSGWIDAGLRIKEYLINHVLSEDMKYAAYYRNVVCCEMAAS